MQHDVHCPASSRLGLLWMLVAVLLWGTVGVATRTMYEVSAASPLTIGLFRLALALPLLLVAYRRSGGRFVFPVTRRDLALMFLFGVTLALFQVCYFAAIARVGVTVATLVAICAAPPLVALTAGPLLGEQVTRRVLLALGAALVGTALLVVAQGSGVGPQRDGAVGVLLALAAAAAMALGTLVCRSLVARYHPLQLTMVGFATGALLLLPCALATGGIGRYSPLAWTILLYLALGPTALAYLFFLTGLRSTTATVASIATMLETLTSTTLAWLLFGERLGLLGLAGAILLLGTLALLYPGGHRKARHPRQNSSSASSHLPYPKGNLL